MKKIYLFLILLVMVGGLWAGYEIYKVNHQPVLVGGDTDPHGCIPSAGYTWCPSTNKCQRMWEEYCEEFKDNFRFTVKDDLIRLVTPRPEELVASPLVIKGEARGTWFFEASFPVILTDWDGLIIATGVAHAESDPDAMGGAGWMTEEYVPFTATLNFVANKTVSNRGSLILKKDNPSGLPANDNALEITVFFK